MRTVALVVGASSGLGRQIAARLAGAGYRTYAGARAFASAESAPPDGCIPLALDVTDAGSVAAAADAVLSAEGRIDVLVNCAARIVMGPAERVSPETLAAVLDTNTVGMARVTQAVLPAMRAQGAGRIITLSSLNGRLAIPFQGAYSASKHAVEGWCEALSMEVRPLGIWLTLVEPGDCRGGSQAYRDRAPAPEPYTEACAKALSRIDRDEAGGMDPDAVARAVLRTLRKKRPPLRVCVARIDQRLAVWLHMLLSGRLFERILRFYYRT